MNFILENWPCYNRAEMLSNQKQKIAVLSLLLLPLIYYWPAVSGQIVLCPDDGWMINLPMRAAAARIALGGEFPLWNPYIFGGMPLLGAIQGGILFPPNWSFLILPMQTAVNFVMLCAYITAGLGAYCYARRAGASAAGAFVTGLVWQFCGFMVAPMGHMNSIQAASLLPWILWAIDGYGMNGENGRRHLSAGLVAVFVALQIFAGHPQTFIYSMFVAVAYSFAMAFRTRPVNRHYIYAVAMILFGFALGAVQLIPTWELSKFSIRQGISYDFFASFSMPASFLFNFFAPYTTGGGDGRFFQLPYPGPNFYAEYIGYAGVLTIMLALAAIWIKRDSQTIFWGCLAVICLILTLGGELPFGLYRLIYYIPGLNLFRVPARHLMEVDFALAVLAGRGLTLIVQAQAQIHAKKIIGSGVGVICLTLAAVFGLMTSANWQLPEFWCPLLLAVAGLTIMWMLARGYKYAALLVIIFVIFDLSIWGQFSGWRASPAATSEIFNEIPVINFLRLRENDGEVFRVLNLNPPQSPGNSVSAALHPNIYMLNGIRNVSGYDAFGLQRFTDFADGIKEWGELNHPLQNLRDDLSFDLLNVRYLIAKRTADGKIYNNEQTFDEKLIAGHWQFLAQLGEVGVYQNLHSTAPAWQATKAILLPNERDILSAIRTGKLSDGRIWDSQHDALLSEQVEQNFEDKAAENSTLITAYSANKIAVKTSSKVSSVLILAENYYPGWKVKVDGEEKEIICVNFALRGVELPPGMHQVEFAYQPKSFLIGAFISIISATMLILILIFRRRLKLIF